MQTRKPLISRLAKPLPARISLVVIVGFFAVSLFAYLFIPDKSPDANTMIVELSARPPGFKKEFLLVPKPHVHKETNKLKGAFFGRPNLFLEIPINGYRIARNHIVVRHYIDYGIEDTLTFDFSSFPLPNSVLGGGEEEYFRTHFIKKRTFLLGTDRFGRDIFSRLAVGSRVSVAVGLVSVVLSIGIGLLLGSIAGWYGGIIDNIVMWLINVLWSIPTLLLVFAITLTIGKGFWQIFIAIGLTSWVSAARLIRGQVMQLRQVDFVSAAKALGFSDGRILFRHILPNIIGPIMVVAAANFATAILVEAGLSFLGIGVQPPTPSWGLMIKEHYTFLVAGNPIPALLPGLAIMTLVLAFNILGNALRDAVDVHTQTS